MENFLFLSVALSFFLLYPTWIIFKRAGLNPFLSLTVFVPVVGICIAGFILAILKWKFPNKEIVEGK